MIRPKFPTKEELLNMPVKQIQGLDIIDPDEEALVQEVMDIINPRTPLSQIPVYDLDIRGMEISTPEQEREIQLELDKRRQGAAILNGVYTKEEVLESNIEQLEQKKEKIESEMKEEKEDGVKCELCGSKGFRHKKDCPTLK